MPDLRIAVYTMAKNEIDHVDRFAETTRGADCVVVTDTGSTDGTQDALRKHGITVCEAKILPWRFDHGTNAALHNVPGDIDVCVKLDLDEVLYTHDKQPWRNEIEQLWTGDITQIGYWYTWSWLKRGETPGVRFRAVHIHARQNYHWRFPGHSALTSMKEPKIAEATNLEIHHYMVSKGRPDYLHLLELGVKESPCPRTMYYLGREYFFRNRPKDAVNLLMDYLEHKDAHWNAERASAMLFIGLAWEKYQHYDKALMFIQRATGEFPNCRDIWFELLRFFHERGDFSGGYWAGLRCLTYTDRQASWVGQVPQAWTEQPFALLAKCASHIGLRDQAIKFSQQALDLNPSNELAKQVQLVTV